MRPRNDQEREVLRLSALLPKLNDRQIVWGMHKASNEYYNDKHRFDGWVYYPTTIRGWQVLRMAYVNRREYVRNSRYHKKGETYGYCDEVLQKWIKVGNPIEVITIGVGLKMFPNYYRNPFSVCDWGWETDPKDEEKTLPYRGEPRTAMSIKTGDWYNDWRDLEVYPRGKWIPELTPTIKASVKDGCSIDWWKEVRNTYKETLLKLGQFDLLKAMLHHRHDYHHDHELSEKEIENSAKIVLRHGGFPKGFDYQTWIDHLDVMKQLGMDIHNPRLLMPEDLMATHQRLNERLARKKAEDEIRRKYEVAKKNPRVVEGITKRNAKWGQFTITENGLTFVPLITIEDYVYEGKRMHHCVGGYYDHFGSLILSARDANGRRWETIEVELKKYDIVQSQGPCDKPTERHEEIKGIVMRHMDEIRKIQSKRVRTTAVAS